MVTRPPPTPTAESLREAALAHLSRYAATERQLLRVLTRRIDRWARQAAEVEPDAVGIAHRARAEAAEIVRRLATAGAVDDTAFAAARATRLARTGHSRRAIGAHLVAKGVDAATAKSALPDDPEAELDAALAFARRRRIGPFRLSDADAASRRREAAAFACAGFAPETAYRALRMAADAASARLLRARRRVIRLRA